MLSSDLKPAFGCDHDNRRFLYCGRRVHLPYFGRVVLEREGFRSVTLWWGEPRRTPLEAWIDAMEWAASYVPRERKTPRPQRCGPLGKAV